MALPSATSPAGARNPPPPPLENHAPDDASISTLVSGQSAFPAEDPMVETTLRFEFKPKDQTAAAKTAFLHTQLLAHLQSNFEDDIKIYDNKGTALPQIDTVEWHSSTVHQRHFKIHVIPGNDRRMTKHFIQHRIRTTQSLSTLRNHHAISNLLKKHNAYVRQHHWDETIYDTIQLGHIIGLNPQHYDNTKAIAIVQQTIQKTTSEQIPPIRMIYSSPSIRHSDKDYRTKAYSIETERKNAPAVLKLLKNAYQITDNTTIQDHRFLIAKLRYSHPESYVNAIKMQTQLLTNTYVIPLLYVTPEALFYIVMARTLKEARYKLKTTLGISELDYTHTSIFPIYGTGQGSGNSPAIWCIVSSVLFDCHEERAHGATFESPDRKQHIKIFMIGFVDDSTGQVNDFSADPQPSPEAIIERMRQDAQLWSDLLWSSGGALEFPKCTYQVFHWTFTLGGAPILQTGQVGPPIHLHSGTRTSSTTIQPLTAYQSHKTLGTYQDPAGSQLQQYQHLKRTSDTEGKFIQCSPLHRHEAWTYYRSIYLPKISYPLQHTHFTSIR